MLSLLKASIAIDGCRVAGFPAAASEFGYTKKMFFVVCA
jgi:hypothetical protein